MAGLQAKVELTVLFGLMMGVMSGRSSGKTSNQLALIKNLENARKIQEEIMKDLKVGDEVLITDEKYECNGKTGIVLDSFEDAVRVSVENGDTWLIDVSSLKKINKIMTNEEFDKVQKQTKELIEEIDRKLNEPKEEPKKEEVYLVWTPKGNNPRKRHPSIEEAEKEAERLAKLNPNKEFYVLKAVKKFMGCTTVESLEL